MSKGGEEHEDPNPIRIFAFIHLRTTHANFSQQNEQLDYLFAHFCDDGE